MLVRRRGPRRIPGPRRPHPCGKDIMIFSLVDFMGYAMTVISGVEHLNIDSDFDNWQVSLDGFDSVSGRYFGCGECSWLLRLQMVRPKFLDS